MPDWDTNLLMIPGPVPVHPRVFRTMSKTIYGHRTDNYREILTETVKMLRSIMKLNAHDVYIFSGSKFKKGINRLIISRPSITNSFICLPSVNYVQHI